MRDGGELYIVHGPKFVAGFIVKDGRVVKAAPILGKIIGLTYVQAMDRITVRGWRRADGQQ